MAAGLPVGRTSRFALPVSTAFSPRPTAPAGSHPPDEGFNQLIAGPAANTGFRFSMIRGFEKIVEERILSAQKKGALDNLAGAGKPLNFSDDAFVPEDLRLAFKILKNAGFLPPEIELKKEISRTEALLAGIEDAAEKYRILKKLNFLIMKLNTIRNASIRFEVPQKYQEKLVSQLASTRINGKRS